MIISAQKEETTNKLIEDIKALQKSGMDVGQVRLVESKRRCETRIKSAIKKDKQTSLPNTTKDLNLSKFEHNGKDGPLVVFAEELYYRFGKFDNYKVVTSYHPSDTTHSDNIASTKKPKTKTKVLKPKKALMLNDKDSRSLANNLTDNSGFEVHNSFHKELRLPKLNSSSIRQKDDHHENYSSGELTSPLEFSKNTELPKLPAREYIDNFRRDAEDFERSLSLGISRASTERRLLKVKSRDSILPKIDEKTMVLSTNTDKLLTKDDHFRLPKLQQKKETQSAMETVNKKKRKVRNGEQSQRKTAHQDGHSRRSMSHSERKAAAQKEQAKWCKVTMQSNAYT